jgi:type IV pilus modification protein PilV
MEELLFIRKVRRQRGFTLVETMVAILVLTIGLFSVAALMGSSLNMGAHARYMSTAALLGYNDSVQISANNGNIVETTSAGGTTTLYTQAPGGNMTVTPNGAMPAASKDTLTFNRQWTIVDKTPVNGVKQITVTVTLTNTSLKPPVTFQTSMVHP